MTTSDDALRRWSQLHDGYEVERSVLVRGWLRLMHAAAPVLVRRGVSPDAVTAAGVVAATAAVVVGGPMSAPLVVLTAVCDGLDGAVALECGHYGPHGTLIDHGADRVTDVLFALALWRAGAHRGAAVADAALAIGYESARSLMRRRGRAPALVTVGERPMRVAVTVIGASAAPTAGAAAVAVMCAASLVQLVSRRSAALRPWSGVRAGD